MLYSSKEKLPVVTFETIFQKIDECHSAVGHLGRDKTWSEVRRRFSCIPLETVRIFISLCDHCVTRKVFPKPIVGKPIVSVGFMTRIQMDLIDMRSVEHNGFKWIFHAKDHFSKFSWLRPLISKEAVNVAETLKSIFYEFGPPRILQSDNGREFVAKVIIDLTKMWPGLLIINGRPRHPQSQGLVERSNAVVQQLLGKWLDSNHTSDWPAGLGPVMFSINTSVACSTKKTPYEVAFGQQPRIDDHIWKSIEAQIKEKHGQEVILEEDLSDDIIDMIKEVNQEESELVDDENTEKINQDDAAVACSVVTTVNDTNDYHIRDEEDTRPDPNIDHEEIIDANEPVLNDICMNTDPTETDQHTKIREEAQEAYLNNAHTQLTRYMSRSAKRKRTYAVGDIVGLKVADVDRTNTSSTILPCKIFHSNDKNGETLYTVATKNGIIKESFQSSMFLDLTTSNFASLRDMNTESLPSITFIQACQLYTNFKVADTCKCAGDCSTNRCQCKRKKTKCCSKCHNGNRGKCKNC
ncbi:unnamed protein product [Rotaria sp. Silwood1]|nr:unnamed protein product [Rotaria sp. Silwood1]